VVSSWNVDNWNQPEGWRTLEIRGGSDPAVRRANRLLGLRLRSWNFICVNGKHGQPLNDPVAGGYRLRTGAWQNFRQIAKISAETA